MSDSGWSWRALVAGFSVNFAAGLVLMLGSGVLYGLLSEHIQWVAYGVRASSALIDIFSGALAGYIAIRRGAAHGLVISLAASLVSLPFAVFNTWWAIRDASVLAQVLGLQYWINFMLWTLVGAALAMAGGHLGALWRRAQS